MPILLLWPVNQVYNLATKEPGTYMNLLIGSSSCSCSSCSSYSCSCSSSSCCCCCCYLLFFWETNTSSQLGWHNVQWNPDLAAAPLTTVVWRLNHVRFAAWIKLLRRRCRWEIYWHITETPSRPSRESHICVCARNVLIHQHFKTIPPAKKKTSLTPYHKTP